MKLFLTSQGVSSRQATILFNLVGKKPTDTRTALIENAADIDPDWSYVYENRENMKAVGIAPDVIDLRAFHEASAVRAALEPYDIIWIGGGNTFYLRWLLERSGLDTVLGELLLQGRVYVGGSAGSIVVGPTLRYFETADNPADAPRVILDGLGLISKVVVPHFRRGDYAAVMQGIDKNLRAAHFDTMPLEDGEVLVMNGADLRTV